MNKILNLAFLLLPLLASAPAMALNAGNRSISQIFCSNDNAICAANVTGPTSGPLGCQSTSFRWLTDSVNGKSTLALLTAAMINGKLVNFELNGACFAPQKTFPSIDQITVLN